MGYLQGRPKTGPASPVKPARPGRAIWQTGGGATWLGGYYDPETDSVPSAPATRRRGTPTRPGDNLYSASSLAIDPSTGKIKWHYQTTPNDGWDFDGVNKSLVSFDLRRTARPSSRRQG